MTDSPRSRDFFSGKRCLVTGGLGFIGSHLARALAASGADVVLVDSMIPEYGGNLHNIEGIQDRVRVNFADVRDGHSMQYLVQDRDFIFNLAGQVSHWDSMEDPFTDLDINCRAQVSILEACRKFNRDAKIVFAGTRQIYGRPSYLPIDEAHPVRPVDVNGINKMAGERYHILYNDVYGIRACSLRLTNTYGPGMLVKHSRQTALGWFVRLVVEGGEVEIFGDGTQMRDYNYVDDVVDAFLLAAADERSNGRIYNLGGLEPTEHRQLLDLLIELAGSGSYRLVPWPPEKKALDVGDVYSSFQRIEVELGWRPRVALREGLARTVEFFRKNRERYW